MLLFSLTHIDEVFSDCLRLRTHSFHSRLLAAASLSLSQCLSAIYPSIQQQATRHTHTQTNLHWFTMSQTESSSVTFRVRCAVPRSVIYGQELLFRLHTDARMDELMRVYQTKTRASPQDQPPAPVEHSESEHEQLQDDDDDKVVFLYNNVQIHPDDTPQSLGLQEDEFIIASSARTLSSTHLVANLVDQMMQRCDNVIAERAAQQSTPSTSNPATDETTTTAASSLTEEQREQRRAEIRRQMAQLMAEYSEVAATAPSQ